MDRGSLRGKEKCGKNEVNRNPAEGRMPSYTTWESRPQAGIRLLGPEDSVDKHKSPTFCLLGPVCQIRGVQ